MTVVWRGVGVRNLDRMCELGLLSLWLDVVIVVVGVLHHLRFLVLGKFAAVFGCVCFCLPLVGIFDTMSSSPEAKERTSFSGWMGMPVYVVC